MILHVNFMPVSLAIKSLYLGSVHRYTKLYFILNNIEEWMGLTFAKSQTIVQDCDTRKNIVYIASTMCPMTLELRKKKFYTNLYSQLLLGN